MLKIANKDNISLMDPYDKNADFPSVMFPGCLRGKLSELYKKAVFSFPDAVDKQNIL